MTDKNQKNEKTEKVDLSKIDYSSLMNPENRKRVVIQQSNDFSETIRKGFCSGKLLCFFRASYLGSTAMKKFLPQINTDRRRIKE